MRLLVIRHGVAMERADYQREIGGDDDFRPLTDDGSKKMKQNAKGLRRKLEAPELLIASPLTRAQQTAEILRDVWKLKEIATCEQLRPGTEPEDFHHWLRGKGSSPDSLIAIVGHEPQLSMMVGWLTCGISKTIFDFKKGGACLIDFASKTGIAKSKGKILWLATPSLLRAI